MNDHGPSFGVQNSAYRSTLVFSLGGFGASSRDFRAFPGQAKRQSSAVEMGGLIGSVGRLCGALWPGPGTRSAARLGGWVPPFWGGERPLGGAWLVLWGELARVANLASSRRSSLRSSCVPPHSPRVPPPLALSLEGWIACFRFSGGLRAAASARSRARPKGSPRRLKWVGSPVWSAALAVPFALARERAPSLAWVVGCRLFWGGDGF